jgi:hypothetical protein
MDLKKVRALVENKSVQESSGVTSSLPTDGLASVEYDIFRACNEARRDRSSVTLIAVSKTFEADASSP